MAFVTLGRILSDNVHVTVMIHPQFPHNDIVHRCVNLAPAESIAGRMEFDVGIAKWHHL